MVLAGKSGEGDTFLPSLDQNKFKKRSRLWEFKELEKESVTLPFQAFRKIKPWMRDVGQAHVFYISVKKEFYCDNLLLILLFILPGIPFEVAVSYVDHDQFLC